MLTVMMMMVPRMASANIPAPQRQPMAAEHQTVAAVVRPLIVSPSLKIIPAPRKPIPDTTCAMIRLLSPPMIDGDIRTYNALPMAMSEIVRVPTTLPCSSRSAKEYRYTVVVYEDDSGHPQVRILPAE